MFLSAVHKKGCYKENRVVTYEFRSELEKRKRKLAGRFYYREEKEEIGRKILLLMERLKRKLHNGQGKPSLHTTCRSLNN
ncbi:hypothetical protein HanHA300_Chr13g0503831 [Helianthus annuus]|nr:hypothetical protein HanHA300_Chr13g0503831 [Helianthus annuus]KAJ0851456.1 hypothetical protein HanPSC8_Chr13g0592371 [Helianthus annuus]